MLKIYLPVFILLILSGCKTGEIDEISILNEEVNFEITEHLYPGTHVLAIAHAGPNHWFYAAGKEIIEVISNQRTIHTVSSQVRSMDWNKPEGALWFGTETSGLGRLKNGEISYFTKESHGLPRTQHVRNITCDNQGGVWFNSSAHKLGGVGYYRNGNFTFYTPGNSILPDNLVKSIATDGTNIYIATGGYVNQQKLVRIKGYTWELLPVTGYYLTGIAADRNGMVYVIDDYGLSSSFPNNSHIIRFDGQYTTSLRPIATPGSWYYPYQVAIDKRDYLWVAKAETGKENKPVHVYTGKEWLEPASFPEDWINCITVDHANTVWLGTINGIYRLKQ